jgi:hypothetical protein
MLLLFNTVGITLFITIGVLGLNWIKQQLVNRDWFSAGALCSLYLVFFPWLLGGVIGIVSTFPVGMQKQCGIILVPLSKFALCGSVFGLILFVSCGAAHNVTANAKAGIKNKK